MSKFTVNHAVIVQGRLPEQSYMSGRTYANHLPDYIKDRFKKVMFKSKGKANNPVCLELSINGVPEDTIAQVAEILDENKYYYNRDIHGDFDKNPDRDTRIMVNDDDRGIKKKRGYISRGYDRSFNHKDTLIGRKLKEIFGDAIERPNASRWDGLLGWYNQGTCYNCVGTQYPPHSSYVDEGKRAYAAALNFTKFDEAKRQEILKNKITLELCLTRNYQNFVPNMLKEKGVTEKAFVQQQTTKYFEELYAITQAEPAIEMEGEIDGDCRLTTLSEIGYSNSKIKDPQTLALIETVYMSMEGLGIGLYHKPKGYRGNYSRGYRRLLQKINQAYKQFGTLMRKGFDAETARTTVIEQLEFWISEWKNTDQNWVVFKRKDWDKPENLSKKKGAKAATTRTTKKVASLADAKAILSGNKTEEG